MPSPVAPYEASPNDRSFPAPINEEGQHEFVGTLEPNWYCRGWNQNRSKYCKARAGANTDHLGVGRCFRHGGATPIRNGRYSKIKRQELRHLIEELENDPDPLDMFPELATARALFMDWVNRYDVFIEALLAWHGSFTEEGQAAEENGEAPVARKPRQVLDISDGYRLLDLIRKTVASIEKIASENAISRPELLRVMTEMGRVVESVVADESQLEKIRDGWGTIRIG